MPLHLIIGGDPHFVAIRRAEADTERGSARNPRRTRRATSSFGSTRLGDANAGCHSFVRVGEDAAAHTAEQRGAVGGALVDRGPLERDAEHGGDDLVHSSLRAPPPEMRPTLASKPRLAHQLQRVAQPVGDAFEHGAGERAAVVAQRQPGERAARVRIGVWRPLAGRGTAGRAGLRRPAPSARPLDERRRTRRRRRRAATAASRPRRASRPSRATFPAPRGRRCAAAPAGRRGSRAARRRRRPRCRARPRAGPARSIPTPSAPAAWSPAPAISVDSYDGGQPLARDARARRAPRRSTAGSRRRRAASPTRPPRRSRARPVSRRRT